VIVLPTPRSSFLLHSSSERRRNEGGREVLVFVETFSTSVTIPGRTCSDIQQRKRGQPASTHRLCLSKGIRPCCHRAAHRRPYGTVNPRAIGQVELHCEPTAIGLSGQDLARASIRTRRRNVTASSCALRWPRMVDRVPARRRQPAARRPPARAMRALAVAFLRNKVMGSGQGNPGSKLAVMRMDPGRRPLPL
jgi:hypothetical protein